MYAFVDLCLSLGVGWGVCRCHSKSVGCNPVGSCQCVRTPWGHHMTIIARELPPRALCQYSTPIYIQILPLSSQYSFMTQYHLRDKQFWTKPHHQLYQQLQHQLLFETWGFGPCTQWPLDLSTYAKCGSTSWTTETTRWNWASTASSTSPRQ